MSIRTRIFLFLVFVALAILTTGIVTAITQTSDRAYLEDVEQAHQRLEALGQVAVHANRYSKQIAEVLLLGEDEREACEAARARVKAVMADLYDRTCRLAASTGEVFLDEPSAGVDLELRQEMWRLVRRLRD